MTIKIFGDLFRHVLRDALYAERRILRSLPKMARKAKSAELKKAFGHHRLGYSKNLPSLLGATLDEEKQTDATLTKLAESQFNPKAAA